MRHPTAKLALLFLLLSAFCAAHAQTDPATTQYNNLAVSTSLVRPDLRPWHMVMNFQLYDLNGKKQETGTIEEWWVSPQSHRLVITSPSYNLTEPSDAKPATDTDAPASNVREAYLVRGLLGYSLYPMSTIRWDDTMRVMEHKADFGKAHLNCLTALRPVAPGVMKFVAASPSYCIEPDTSNLRIFYDSETGLDVGRNHLELYQNTQLALSNSVAYYGKAAIEGTIVKFDSFDPTKNPVALENTPLPKEIPSVGGIRAGVMAGKRISGARPIYPPVARAAQITGSVFLAAVISKKGKVKSLSVIATSNSMLTGAALDAVKTWTYQPSLLDGKPTEVDSNIIVNFARN